MIDRRRFLAGSSVLLAASTLGIGRSWAQEAAARKVIFGYPAGAVGSDLGNGMTAVLASSGGQRYQLENIEGSNTRKSAEVVKASAPDGMTLLQAQSTTMCLLPNIYKNMSYDPLKDFVPLANIGRMTQSLTLGPMVPESVDTLAKFLAWLDKNPDSRDVGFAIYGSEGHLATLILAKSQNVTVRAQPYRGSKMMIDDLLGGTLAAGFTAAGNGGRKLWSADGKWSSTSRLRSIGVTTHERLSYWPSIATLAEQGVQGMDLSPWYGWYAPAGTPAAAADSVRASLLAAQATPAYDELLKRLLLTRANDDPNQMRQRILADTARYAKLVAEYGPTRVE